MRGRIDYFKETYRNSENLVLIHQMGKVGSTSLTVTLKEMGFLPIHIHSFYTPLSARMYKNYQSIKYYRPRGYRSRYFLRHKLVLNLLKRRKKLKIISLVREPFSRNMSMYFHNFQIPLMDIHKYKDNRRESNTNMEAVRKDFLGKFNHTYGINWFRNEFERAWGINVFDYPFNREAGYTIIEKDNIEILLLKMEKLDDCEEVIAEFLDTPSFSLKNENMGDRKWYHAVYKEFKSGMEPEGSHLDMLYDSDFMNHFYTEQEKEAFKEKYNPIADS